MIAGRPPAYSPAAHRAGDYAGGLPAIKLEGDRATARTFCFNPMILKGEKPKVMQVGVWYDDEFVRTAAGWRLSRRVEIKCYDKIL